MTPLVRLFAALKGDGYGHGCVQSARVVLESGAHGVALANLDECLQIREDGITAPVLLYAGTPSYLASTVVRLQITPTVTDFDAALAFSRVAPDGYGVFVKVDCGLERAGVYAEEALQLVLAVSRLPRIRIAGLYTHMHSGSGSDEYARWQFSRFDALLRQVDQVGIHVPIKLAASSPFIGRYPEMLLNAIDPEKDVDGFHPLNIGRLCMKRREPMYVPCTPRGCCCTRAGWRSPARQRGSSWACL